MALNYIKKYDSYFNSTKTNEVKANTFEAWSYDWWKYATKYKGLRIFNNTTYSSTTSKHQSDARSVLIGGPDVVLYHTRLSLDNVEDALKDEIELLRYENKTLLEKIQAPRTQKKTNAKRANEVTSNAQRIQELKDVLKLGGVIVESHKHDNAFTKMHSIMLGLDYNLVSSEV